MKNKKLIFLIACFLFIFEPTFSIRNHECNVFINSSNHTGTNVFYVNSNQRNDSLLEIKYGMINNSSYIEAYKIIIVCNFKNINSNLIVSRNISTIRGIVIINNCTSDETFDLNIPDLNGHYHYLDFKLNFNSLSNQKSAKIISVDVDVDSTLVICQLPFHALNSNKYGN